MRKCRISICAYPPPTHIRNPAESTADQLFPGYVVHANDLEVLISPITLPNPPKSCTLLYMQNGPVCINQTYSTFPMSLPSVVRPKRVLRELFRLQLFSGQVGRQTLSPLQQTYMQNASHNALWRTHAHIHTRRQKKTPNTIDIIDKRAVVVLVGIIVIEKGRNYYCSKHKNRYTYIKGIKKC